MHTDPLKIDKHVNISKKHTQCVRGAHRGRYNVREKAEHVEHAAIKTTAGERFNRVRFSFFKKNLHKIPA